MAGRKQKGGRKEADRVHGKIHGGDVAFNEAQRKKMIQNMEKAENEPISLFKCGLSLYFVVGPKCIQLPQNTHRNWGAAWGRTCPRLDSALRKDSPGSCCRTHRLTPPGATGLSSAATVSASPWRPSGVPAQEQKPALRRMNYV